MALNFQNNDTAPMRRILLIVLLALSLALTMAYAYEGSGGPLHTVQSACGSLSAPFKFAGSSAASAAGGASSALEDATASEQTLSALREKNDELLALVAQDEEIRQENERLRGLLGMQETYGVSGVTAQVIGRGTDAWNQTVTINKGSADGVDTGLTVMAQNGVIGQVIATSNTTATVRLLTDPKSGAAALIQSSRAEGIVRGSLDGLLYLQNIDADVQVSVGDLVLTSGLGGSYVRGLLIGTIVKVEGSAGDATRTIVVSPNDAAQVLEDVLVVKEGSGASDAAGTSDAAGASSSAAADGSSSAGGGE